LTYAIVISVILHLLVFIYIIFGGKAIQKDAYPRIMTVDLVSMPPISKGKPAGTETPGKTEAKAIKPKAETKVEQKPDAPRLAEIEKKKRQPRKKPKQKPKTQAETSKNNTSKNAEKSGIDEDRLGLPEGVEFGSEFGTVRLEGASFETPTYLNILFAKIKYRWDNPFQGMDTISCFVYFTILRNGDLADATVETSSGIAAFDQSALRAVLSSKPPPLPLEYTGNQLGVHLQFKFVP